MTFENKLAVVTGAASGIGRALAIDLAWRGARLALADINEAGLRDTCNLMPQNAVVKHYRLDVTSAEAVVSFAEKVTADLGPVHYLFNNAGATIFGTWEHLSLDEIRWQVDVNLWSVIYGVKAFLPGMLTRREGCIVNVSSIFGLIGFAAQGPYCVSKFGVRAITESLWAELAGTGVRAVSVHPGGIRTGIDRAARFSQAHGPLEEAMAGMTEKLLVTPPEVCARQILDGVAKGRNRILTGSRARTIHWLSRLFPNSYPKILTRLGISPG